jgi:large subunit ribosomal protein L25
LSLDEDALIVNISAAQTAEELEADIAEAEADLGVEHDQPDAEEADAETGDEAPAEGTEGSAEE